MSEAIHITIDDTGAVHLEVQGIAGPRCEQLTEPLTQLLGLPTTNIRKPDYYQTGCQTHAQH